MNAFHSISIKDPWHLILANFSHLTCYLTYLSIITILLLKKNMWKKVLW